MERQTENARAYCFRADERELPSTPEKPQLDERQPGVAAAVRALITPPGAPPSRGVCACGLPLDEPAVIAEQVAAVVAELDQVDQRPQLGARVSRWWCRRIELMLRGACWACAVALVDEEARQRQGQRVGHA